MASAAGNGSVDAAGVDDVEADTGAGSADGVDVAAALAPADGPEPPDDASAPA